MAKVKISLIVIGFTTGEKVYEKSNPWTWFNPVATRGALYLFIEPFAFFSS